MPFLSLKMKILLLLRQEAVNCRIFHPRNLTYLNLRSVINYLFEYLWNFFD